MADVDGVWDTMTKTPMGDQASVLTIKRDGDSLVGVSAAQLGDMQMLDGKIDGDRLTWRMEMKLPFPMTLEADVVISGDTMSGGIKAGAFGVSPITGKRRT